MLFQPFEIEEIKESDEVKREKLAYFLEKQHLTFEEDIEYSLVCIVEDKIVATASYAKNILKCIAVEEAYQGEGVAEYLVSELMSKLYLSGEGHYFLVTKRSNKKIFEGLGFCSIAEANEPFMLMEYPRGAVKQYISTLRETAEEKETGCLIMNCNPFTLGHLHLIEHAARQCEILHIFIVSEDLSAFPTKARYKMVEEGTKHLSNVRLHYSGEYMISQATFPSYFLKDKSGASKIHAEIDVDFFSRYIIPSLNIKKRFLGEEPDCMTTALYNQVIKEKLPEQGVEVQEIERLKVDQTYVSASLVRKLINQGKINQVKQFVPSTTYKFLTSNEGKNIINKINKRRIQE